MTSVAVVACVYGDYGKFEGSWRESLERLNRQPDEIVVYHGDVLYGDEFPQPRFQNTALWEVRSEWVWKLDIDDHAVPTALDGIDDVLGDVWLMGHREAARDVIPPTMTNERYLAMEGNPYPSNSAFRWGAWFAVDGYPVIEHEDWGLWRKLARAGYIFESSGRVHSIHRTHLGQRSRLEVAEYDRRAHRRAALDL